MAISKPTATEVIDLTGTELTEAQVTALIDDAALMVEACINTLSADRQSAIVKWVAAHLIQATGDDSGNVLSSTKLGDASDTFARGSLGDGLSGSYYGQQAIALDPNGCLARLGRAKAKIQVV